MIIVKGRMIVIQSEIISTGAMNGMIFLLESFTYSNPIETTNMTKQNAPKILNVSGTIVNI